MPQYLTGRATLSVVEDSCCFDNLVEEFLPLRSRQKPEEAEHGQQQNLGASTFQMRPRQEIRADHLQTIPPRLVRSEHESRRIDRLFDHRRLAPVDLEIDQLTRFGIPPGQFLLHLTRELLPRH